MASFYPHKQTLVISVISIAAVAAAWWYASAGTASTSRRSTEAIATPQTVSTQNASLETSSSTVEDWRSLFIAATSTLPARTTSDSQAPQEDLTVTDKFSRDFFARFISMKQTGLIENPQFVQSSLEQSVYLAEQETETGGQYNLSDISVSSSIELSTIKMYGNSVAMTFALYAPAEDAATVANSALESGNYALLAKLDPIIASYDQIVSELKKIITPQPLAGYHLQLINSVAEMASISRALRAVEQDPIRAIVSIKNYAAAQQSIVSVLRSMKAYFVATSIVFLPSEPGSMFSNI